RPAAFALSSHSTTWRPWSTFTNGAYAAHLPEARRAAAAAAHHGSTHHGAAGTGTPSAGRRIVLDLTELSRLANLFRHSADRVQHTRRELDRLAGEIEPARIRLHDNAL